MGGSIGKHMNYLGVSLISDTPKCPSCGSSKHVFLVIDIGIGIMMPHAGPRRSKTYWHCETCLVYFQTPEQCHIKTSEGFMRL